MILGTTSIRGVNRPSLEQTINALRSTAYLWAYVGLREPTPREARTCKL